MYGTSDRCRLKSKQKAKYRMNILQLSAPATHAGHNHGAFGEWIEQLFSLTSLPEQWQEFLSHFVIDTLQIFALLLIVMTAVYFLSSYINMDRLHHKLEHLKSIPGFALAIVAGTLSPFCSCSIIPVLIGLLSVGVPASVCLCYLTASSMLNLTAIVSVYAVAGAGFGTAYLLCSLLIIIGSSIILSLFKLDAGVKHYVDEHHHHHEVKVCNHCIWHRLKCALLSTVHVISECWFYILLGVGLSSAVTAFLSMDAITQTVNSNGLLSTTIVALVGIPIHSDIFSIAPVLMLLIDISPAVAMGFALSAMAISIPSIVILTRALKARTVATYCGVIVGLTLIVSYAALLIL